jgi:hypothetical protein
MPSNLRFLTGEFDEDALKALRASSDVAFIEEDGIVTTQATVSQLRFSFSCIHHTHPKLS